MSDTITDKRVATLQRELVRCEERFTDASAELGWYERQFAMQGNFAKGMAAIADHVHKARVGYEQLSLEKLTEILERFGL